MSDTNWAIYGAYGYTGEQIAEHAVRRGHRPTLAGRNESALKMVAQRLNLPYRVLDVGDAEGMRQLAESHQLVFNAAGPFSQTAVRVLEGCLLGKAHYLDISGEPLVYEQLYAQHERALKAGIAILPGVGFDVVPTDCAAVLAANQVGTVTKLEIAIAVDGGTSRGSLFSVVEALEKGALFRREGLLHTVTAGARRMEIPFGGGPRVGLLAPWGDVASSFLSVGAPNIDVYMAFPRNAARPIQWGLRWAKLGLGFSWLRTGILRALHTIAKRGPEPSELEHTRAEIWARAEGVDGRVAEIKLYTAGSYPFTTESAVLCVERTLELSPTGATTPAKAFGPELVFEITGTRKHQDK